ncbi:MAG: tetratricopeptide repeat protein [Legionellaceae bacterium]|nr:tetratricopeptide repeat protein [Legionellaceae bacterium]
MLQFKLLACFILLSCLALFVALMPLKPYKKSLLVITPVLIMFISLSYWFWGDWSGWSRHIQQMAKTQRVQAMLKSVKGPQELIDKLNAHLLQKPNSARGWYLLGRLYASQNQWELAQQAFATAHQLKPNNELFTVNYAQSLFDRHEAVFADKGRMLLTKLLKTNPKQPDALAMLAMEAYTRHAYQAAIDYWERLLALVPEQSEEASAIRKAIVKAQRQNIPILSND